MEMDFDPYERRHSIFREGKQKISLKDENRCTQIQKKAFVLFSRSVQVICMDDGSIFIILHNFIFNTDSICF